MLLHYVVGVMVTVQWSFSVVTNPVTTVNECWPVIILSSTRNIYTVSILQISWQYASKVYWIIRQVYLKDTCFKYASRVIACQIIFGCWPPYLSDFVHIFITVDYVEMINPWQFRSSIPYGSKIIEIWKFNWNGCSRVKSAILNLLFL